jgi:hypothetical protein
MKGNVMTEEIIRALKTCQHFKSCKDCPLHKVNCKINRKHALIVNALDVITSFQKENERLTAEIHADLLLCEIIRIDMENI